MRTLKPRDKHQPDEADDPVLQMVGIGREMWEHDAGDRFVARLRSEELSESPATNQAETRAEDLHQAVWFRIEKNQGEQFHTQKRLPLTYEVEGNGIWFFRDGKRINRKLTRAQVEVAISRCPLKSTTEIKDLIDYPYLFAVLMDRRIRGQAW